MKSFRQSLPLFVVFFLSLAAAPPAAFGAPSITSLSPATAPVGALVTITGANFGATQGTSTVKFNGTTATIPTGGWSATSIVATVPAGATTGNVVVTVGGVDSNGTNFTVGIVISIPQVVPFGAQTAMGRMQITNVAATVNFPPGTPSVGLTFVSPDTFTVPANKSWSITLTPGMPVLNSCLVDPSEAVACHDFPVPMNLATCLTCTDNITIIPRGSAAAGQMRFEIRFALLSNYNVGGSGTNRCASTQTVNPEHYTIIVTSGTAITGVCVETYDKTLAACTTNQEDVLQPSQGASVAGFPQSTLACAKERPPVDVMMVLDRSGSMSTPTTSGIGATCTPLPANPTERIGALQCAAKNFVKTWANPDAPNPAPAIAGDRVGIVSFSTTASTDSGLVDVTSNQALIDGKIDALAASGSTSIGGGLLTANPPMAPDNIHRKVVLLMSDGQQNRDPLVQGPALNTTGPVTTHCEFDATPCGGGTLPTLPVPLPNQPQFYTVTLGPSLTVNSAINQQIANATLGFYLNTEDNATLLGPFFLELLQNFLKFNSYDTVRLISERAPTTPPYSTEVPISTSSRDVEFSLMWPNNLGALQLTVTPPGGAPSIVRESASGFISIVRSLPLSAPFDPSGNWNVQVKAIDLSQRPTTVGGSTAGIPFDLHIMTDDGGVKSDLSVVPGDYKAGDNIRLRAKLRYFGIPMRGLGSHPSDRVRLDLIKPGQSIGDTLSDSTASSTPAGPDVQAGAEAKLLNTLQNNPSALKHISDTVQLFDDGKPEHGDDVAGDGIYSALYPAILPGHYNFLFSVESTDPNSIRFSRQQLRTAYVRSVPDAGNTVFQTSIFRRDNGNVLSIIMTPRVKPGPGCSISDPKCGRMGPGWANYFWFTAPGQTPFKAKDNLDGTYTATLAFAGSAPPQVSVHFENVLAIIGDSVPPDKLPDPLGQGNVLSVVPCCGGGNAHGRVALFLDAGANIPQGTFGNVFNKGFSLNAGLEYIATSHFSVEGIFGYHHFPAKIAGDLNVYQFSVNGKTYLTNGTIRPFVNAGIGGYKFEGGSTYFGGNVGAGLLFQLSSRLGLEGSYNFHAVKTPVTTKFSTVQGGIRFVF